MAFSVPLSKIGSRIEARLTEQVRERTHELFTKIVKRTPVHTGRARDNWNVSRGRANYSYNPTPPEGRGLSEVNKVWAMPAGSSVFLANGTPYISLLEYGGYPNPPEEYTGRTVGGFSSQAPAGMVRISVLEFGGTIGKTK